MKLSRLYSVENKSVVQCLIPVNITFFFGWLFSFNTYVVDGHDVEELCKALWMAEQFKGKPTAIVAKTFKGKGLKGMSLWSN